MKKLLSFFLFLSGALNAMERKPQPSFTTGEQSLNALAFVAAHNPALVRPIAEGLFEANPHMTRQDIVRYYERPDQQNGTQRRSVLPVPMVHAICDQYHQYRKSSALKCLEQAIEFAEVRTGVGSDYGNAHGYNWEASLFVKWHDIDPLAHPVEKLLRCSFVYRCGIIIIKQGMPTAEEKQKKLCELIHAVLSELKDGSELINFMIITRDFKKADVIMACDRSYVVIIDVTISGHNTELSPVNLRETIMAAIDENRFRIFDTISDTIEFVIARASR